MAPYTTTTLRLAPLRRIALLLPYPTLPSLASAATTAAEASEGPKIQWRPTTTTTTTTTTTKSSSYFVAGRFTDLVQFVTWQMVALVIGLSSVTTVPASREGSHSPTTRLRAAFIVRHCI